MRPHAKRALRSVIENPYDVMWREYRGRILIANKDLTVVWALQPEEFLLATDREKQQRTIKLKPTKLIKLMTETGRYAYIAEKNEKLFPSDAMFFVAGQKDDVIVMEEDDRGMNFDIIGAILPVSVTEEEEKNG